MAREIIHLTLQVITEAIEGVLITYPYYPYRQVFTVPELHRKLVVYVIRQIRSLYTVVIEDAQKSSISPKAISTRIEINGDYYLLDIPAKYITKMSGGWMSIYVRPLISSEQWVQLENFIRQGICHILQESSDWRSSEYSNQHPVKST
jgi:hypothetical protein